MGATTEPAGFTDLTLTVTMPKKSFVALEPISMDIRLHNPTSETIITHRALCFTWEHLDLFVGKQGKTPQKLPRLTLANMRAIFFADELLLGETITESTRLEVDLHKTFPVAGTYEVYGVFSS